MQDLIEIRSVLQDFQLQFFYTKKISLMRITKKDSVISTRHRAESSIVRYVEKV